MTVFELLSDYLQPATLADTVADTLAVSATRGYQVVPVVDEENRLVATISLADLTACSDPDRLLRDGRLNAAVTVHADAHLLNAVQLVVDNDVDLLPVVDERGRYLGAVDLAVILSAVSRMLALGEEGSVIEIDVPQRDYTLGRLTHTIEELGVRILSVYSEAPASQSADVRVVVKVGAGDTLRIRAVLEHYGYKVISAERPRSSAEDIQQRVREFIHYLDV